MDRIDLSRVDSSSVLTSLEDWWYSCVYSYGNQNRCVTVMVGEICLGQLLS